MNDVIKKAQTFLEMLQSASGEEVKHWDAEALGRAIQWAKFFEEVYKKFQNRPKNIQQLNRGLYLIGHLPGAAVHQSKITFESLSQSQRLLLQQLLQNSHLSMELYSEVILQYTLLDKGVAMETAEDIPSTSHDDVTEKSEQKYSLLLQDVSRFAKGKAARLQLLKIRAKLTQALQEELNMEGTSVQDVSMETDAVLLRDHLIHHMTDSHSPQSTREYLEDRLHYMASLPNGITCDFIGDGFDYSQAVKIQTETIETILKLLGDRSENEAETEKQCYHFVSEWMTANEERYGVH